MIAIDTERFLRDLDTLRTIGAYRTGVHRPTFSPQDMESRRWLMDAMAEIGLHPTMDGIGNIIGRHGGPGPHLLVGSHIETQNHAGWLDGALGVVAALALARAGLPVDVGVYSDEEGHWGDFLGSRSLVGDVTEKEIDNARNLSDGSSLRDALTSAGLARLPRLALEAERYKGALELHIEQGTRLEARGFSIGVVSGIVGIRSWRIVFEGQQDHTGGTTMLERRDAGLSAVRLLAAVDEAFPRVCGERSVWTTGRIVLEPNMPMIIPGRAELVFSFRDLSDVVMDRLEDCLRGLVRGKQSPRAVSGDPGAHRPPHAVPLATTTSSLRSRRPLKPSARDAGKRCRAVRSTTVRSSPASCRSACFSFPPSVASATIGRRTPGARTSCSGVQVLGEGANRFLA